MRRWLVAAALIAREASADCPKCECMSYLTALDKRPEPRDVALNARFLTGTLPDLSRDEHFVLRLIGGAPVAVNAEKLHIDTWDTLVLTPTAPLAKNSDYELVLLRGADTLPYGKLHTVDVADTTPPVWTGALDAHFEPADPCSAECNLRRGARVEVTGDLPTDDRSGAELVAVWVTTGKAIDYAKPPTAHVMAHPEEEPSFGLGASSSPKLSIVIGGPGPCTTPSVPLPRGAKRVHIGLKIYDRAGNASAPRELDVKLAAPRAH
jgi:hypothetical protein